jgi:hypothetical protein
MKDGWFRAFAACMLFFVTIQFAHSQSPADPLAGSAVIDSSRQAFGRGDGLSAPPGPERACAAGVRSMRKTQWRPFVEGSAQPVLSSQAHEAVGRDCSCIQQSTAETLSRGCA